MYRQAIKIWLLFATVAVVGTLLSINDVQHRIRQQKRTVLRSNCTNSTECNNGYCIDGVCKCDQGWIDKDGQACSYEQKSKLAAFLLSILLGTFGADWFYLARGDGGYIAAGVFKLLTLGFAGIWWLVDWIRILADGFADGNGVALEPW